uniref:virulence factor TspB C-terminal domain-related protein n=1 Tax=Thiomicrorhabdus sp. TaxID=2039724 RepID=UPI0029C7D920
LLSDNSETFSFDEHEYNVDIFGSSRPCPPVTFDLSGKHYELNMTYFCQTLNFMGLVILAFSYWIAFQIVFAGRR